MLAEWSTVSQPSVAFPEVVVPIIVALRRNIRESKAAKGGAAKVVGGIRTLVERLEDGAKWVKERRAKVGFSPADRSEVDQWQRNVKIAETSVGKYAAVLQKARDGKGEYVEE